MIERQVIVTWTKPEEKLPPEELIVVVTVSGQIRQVTYDHALMLAVLDEREGWFFEELNDIADMNQLTVHAWADLEPYGLVNKGGK